MPCDCYRFLPMYWCQARNTDWAWDQILNELLDSNPTFSLFGYTLIINNTPVWVENYPYSYGYIYTADWYNFNNGIPSVATRKRLRKIVKKLRFNSLRKEVLGLTQTKKV